MNRNNGYGLALSVLWLGAVSMCQAQYLPPDVGPARVFEPAPVAVGKASSKNPVPDNLIPGPIGPDIAPPGPPDDLALPESHSNAFPCDLYGSSRPTIQASVGLMYLDRPGLPNMIIGVTDSTPRQSNARVTAPLQGTVTLPVGFTPPTITADFQRDIFFTFTGFPDDGRPAPAGSPSIGNFGNIDLDVSSGIRAGLMVIGNTTGFELNGFSMSRQGGQTSVISPSADTSPTVSNVFFQNGPFLNPAGFPVGSSLLVTGPLSRAVSNAQAAFGPMFSQLDLPFFNAPASFRGNNGLWLQADAVSILFSSKFSSLEANIRTWENYGSSFETIFGVRYLNLEEELYHQTVDDQFNDVVNPTAVAITGTPPNNVTVIGPIRRIGDPAVTATYATRVKNRIIGPQIGFEGHYLPFSFLALSYTGKAMAGVNALERRVSLTRGDGVVGFDTSETIFRFGWGTEVGATADISLLEGARLRLGYNFFWLPKIASAYGQIDYNLANTSGRRNSTDSTFYHGPMVELQFIF